VTQNVWKLKLILVLCLFHFHDVFVCGFFTEKACAFTATNVIFTFVYIFLIVFYFIFLSTRAEILAHTMQSGVHSMVDSQLLSLCHISI
jgi:hypothetical protein